MAFRLRHLAVRGEGGESAAVKAQQRFLQSLGFFRSERRGPGSCTHSPSASKMPHRWRKYRRTRATRLNPRPSVPKAVSEMAALKIIVIGRASPDSPAVIKRLAGWAPNVDLFPSFPVKRSALRGARAGINAAKLEGRRRLDLISLSTTPVYGGVFCQTSLRSRQCRGAPASSIARSPRMGGLFKPPRRGCSTSRFGPALYITASIRGRQPRSGNFLYALDEQVRRYRIRKAR